MKRKYKNMKALLFLFLVLIFGETSYSQTMDEWQKNGNAKYQLKDYHGAIEDLNKSIALNPQNANAYVTRGLAKSALQDYYGSISDFSKAIEINPKYEVAYRCRGISKAAIQDYKGAIADYNIGIELNPTSYIFLNRATSKYFLLDYNGAIQDCNKAIELYSDYPDSYLLRGLSKIAIGDKTNGCLDLSRAEKLGNEKASDLIKKYCN